MKVFVVYEEKNWDSEEYADVVNVYSDKEKAVAELKELKDQFLQENEELIKELTTEKVYKGMLDMTDKDTYFQCLDNGMGHNYELWVIEKELI